MTISTTPAAGACRPSSEAEESTSRGIYGGRVFDGILHCCVVCGAHAAIAHSVRIRQDERGQPVCIDCQLNGATLVAPSADVPPASHAGNDALRNGASVSALQKRYHPVAERAPVYWKGIGHGQPHRRQERKEHGLPSLGNLVFRRDPARGLDVTALWCGDPPLNQSALARMSARQ